MPKFFAKNEACFLFLTRGTFHFRTPVNFISFHEGDAMLAKCGSYFLEEVTDQDNNHSDVIEATGAFFYPVMVKGFFQTDLSYPVFQRNFDVLKIDVQPLLKSFVDSINYLLDNPAIADENLLVIIKV